MLPSKPTGQYTNYDWCKETYLAAKPHVKEFRVAIDVGCRDGDFTKIMLDDFDFVHAFDYRNRMKGMNNNKKYGYYKVALGDINKDDVEAYKGAIGKIGKKDSIRVKQKKLDDYNFSNVDLIKIDVEGYEMNVIKGAVATIDKNNPVLIIEDNGDTGHDALNFLLSIGYKVQRKFEKPNPLDIVLVR